MTPRAIDLVSVVPRRLTPTERLHEVTMAVLQRKQAEPTTDVEVSRSAVNGRYGFKVAVTATDPLEAETVAGEIADRLAARYPHNGTGAPETPPDPATHARSRGKR